MANLGFLARGFVECIFFGAWLRCGGRAGWIWIVCAVRLKSRAIWLVAVGGAKSVVRVKFGAGCF